MTRQLVVFIENRPGSLLELAEVLRDAGVNVESILLEGSIDFGACRIHTSNDRVAEKALVDAGFQVQHGDVIILKLSNQPGELAELTRKLARAKINIDSLFGTAGGDKSEFIITVEDGATARAALGLENANGRN